MISDKLQALLKEKNREIWLTNGSKLTPYQKSLLLSASITTRKYTLILFENHDLKLSELHKLCSVLSLDPREVI